MPKSIVATLLLLLFLSCSDKGTESDNILSFGEISFSMSVAEAKTQFGLTVDSVTVQLIGPTSQRGKLAISTDSTSAQGTFPNLLAGTYSIFVAVFSASDTIAYGEGSATVLPGKQTSATITLSFLPGKLIIQVNWPPLVSAGLVAAWLFAGNTRDTSGNGNHGTLDGATLTSNRFGVPNNAYAFDGATNNIAGFSTDFDFGTSEFSVSLWIKSNSTNGGGVFTTHDTSASNYSNIGIYLAGTSLGFADLDINNGAGSQTNYSGRVITDNQWHHILANRVGSIGKLYVDGVLDFTDTLIQNPLNSTIFTIGSSFGTAYFQGSIDDIRIYNRALTDIEVLVLYHELGW